jgi:hypothetical protein
MLIYRASSVQTDSGVAHGVKSCCSRLSLDSVVESKGK